MEVRVDSNLIRAERENRGWSQGHLAEVAGLSLRTIQRIEKTGSASFETLTALASVFAVEVAALRVAEFAPPRARAIRLSLELPMRLALALLSGALCALSFRFRWGFDAGWFSPGLLHFGTAGALFGFAVLCPYLVAGKRLVTRALMLVGASALSYFCAMMTALSADSWFSVPRLAAFMLASFVGVTAVLVAVRILIPLRVTAAFWLLGLGASLVGGVVLFAGFEVLGDTALSTVVAFCVWHMLACIVIYLGHRSNDAENGLLATFARARGRFSIVSGWMRLSHSTLG